MTRYIKVQNRGVNQISNTEWIPESEVEAGSAVEVTVLSQSVTLTNDQIKALPTTPVDIVPALGIGKAIFPILVHLQCSAAVDYTGIDAAAVLEINNGGAVGVLYENITSSVSGLLAPGDANDGSNAFISLLQRKGADIFISGISGYYDSDISNKPLKIKAVNAADFTGGDAANTLKVIAVYIVVDL